MRVQTKLREQWHKRSYTFFGKPGKFYRIQGKPVSNVGVKEFAGQGKVLSKVAAEDYQTAEIPADISISKEEYWVDKRRKSKTPELGN